VTVDHLKLEVEAARELSLAMVENAVPLVARISMTNLCEASLQNLILEVSVSPGFSSTWSTHITEIPAAATFHVNEVDLPLDRAKLVGQLERAAADLVVSVRRADAAESMARSVASIDVLAYNEWRAATVPQLLSAFVLPNHPAVAQILGAARTGLERLTGNPALDGYQARDPARSAAIAQAVYEAIQTHGVTYSNPPASFETNGQKVRTPDQVLTERLGTCLDLSLFVASCLEQAGLHALVALLDGHAFPGVWLDDFFVPEGVIDDGVHVRKLVELGRIVVFDSSAVAQRPLVGFEEAMRIGVRHLDSPRFRHALDIRGARAQRFRPLPIRVAGELVSDPGGAVHPTSIDSGPARVPGIAPAGASGRTRTGPTRGSHPRIEAWKQRLLDTSLRNRLLNYRETRQSLRLLCADLAAVEDKLAIGEELTIVGCPPLLGGDDPRSKRLLEARLGEDSVRSYLRERLNAGELSSDSPAEDTSARLTTIYRAAREVIEETGSNTLCITIGMLDWFESESSQQRRRAPILLLPVALSREARTSTFTVEGSGEDARLNVTLFEKLRMDTGITLPELSELPLDQAGVDVPAVLRAVRRAVVSLPRWEVREELHLGLFSFAKFQMWADLEQNADAILTSPVIKHLIDGKGAAFPNTGGFVEPGDIDSSATPRDLVCPLDADASQLAAVAAATGGKTFVLQGPPGTGKSQTITNVVAHCLAHGKRVLFVAEKAAALDVVHRRLSQVGLGPYVLELHSHKAGKLQVLEQFRSALEAQPVTEPADWEASTRKLEDEQRHLNSYVEALHRPRPGGFSIFQALSRLDSLRNASPCELPATCARTEDTFNRTREEVERLQEAAVAISPLPTCPWRGCLLPRWELDLPVRVGRMIERAWKDLEQVEAAGKQLSSALGASVATRLADLDELCTVATEIELGKDYGEGLRNPEDWSSTERDGTRILALTRTRTDALAVLREKYREELLGLDLDHLASRLGRYAHSFWFVAWWGLRGVRRAIASVMRGRQLPAPAELAADIDLARSARDSKRAIEGLGARPTQIFGGLWVQDGDAGALERALAWAIALRATVAGTRPGLLPPRLRADGDLAEAARDAASKLATCRKSLNELERVLGWSVESELNGSTDDWRALRNRFEGWRGSLAQLRDWHAFRSARQALLHLDCEALINDVESDAVETHGIVAAFDRGVLEAWAREQLAGEPLLESFHGEQHRRRVAAFAALDKAHLEQCRKVVLARVSGRAPATAMAGGGEVGLLQRELQKKRRHMPIRKLLREIPALTSRLKPCFLMSPMSVAQYLEPGGMSFDVVVFDEASQMPTWDSAGALARGSSAIIVGDSKQLPPTMFFQGGPDDEDPSDTEFEELESILDECLAAGFPERRLDWHYRSQHESLIAFSNYHYYRNRLNTFPSAEDRGSGRGVSLRVVAGTYDKGGARTNHAEALALTSDLVARLRDEAKGSGQRIARTYGIVTFSQAQQNLVEDLLDRARREHPEIEPFFDEKTCVEPVIVKNLENIQGDERDVVLFSICYGPDQHGRVSMNFGPLNRDGGERRLNVAVTRARQELVVFSTLAPEQIDLTRTQAIGVKHLKTFLDYAKRGPSAIAEALTLQGQDTFDSPFEEEVCERLRALGWIVDTQVGCAGYRIDMAVRDPRRAGRYLVAVECDGAYYHSARSARERDRLRAHVLGGLGWRIHRIWSTDWWADPESETHRLHELLERYKAEPPPAVATPSAAPVQASPADSARSERPPATSEAAVPTSAKASISGSAQEPPTTSGGGYQIPRVTASRAADAPPSQRQGPYEIAAVSHSRRTPDEVHDEFLRDELRRVLLDVVSVEAPITLTLLARRVAPYFSIQRATNRLEERLRNVLGRSVHVRNDVIWQLGQDPDAYRRYRLAPPDAKRDAPQVPVEEVANAAEDILRASVAMEHDELVRLTARALGFSRTGERVADLMLAGAMLMVSRGSAKREGDRFVCVG
jgi:very-short-patch-repair endonuclease